MSATVRIDAEGNLPSFMDRAQSGLERMVKSEHNVKGALRGISEALDTTGNSAQMASKAAEVLSEKFVRGLGGAAVVGAAKILSDMINNVAESLGAVGQKAAKAIDQLKSMGEPANFQDAITQSASIRQTMADINEEILAIEKNPLRNFVAGITGAKEEMQQLSKALQQAAEADLAFGAAKSLKRAQDTIGMTSSQVKEYDQFGERRAQIEALDKISNPTLRKQAQEDLQKSFDFEDQNQRLQSEQKSNESGKAAAEAIGAKFDNDRLDYNRKEADRIAKLEESRAAQKEADQRAYFEKQSKDQKDYSARQDRQTMHVVQAGNAYMDAFTSKNNLETDIAGRGLASSRRGRQYLDQARRDQANNNRIDNYKFNEEQVQKYVDRMQQRGNGQSDKDFERYKNMTPDQAREAARRDLAKQQAQKENPSDREKAASDLAGYLQKVDTLLTQLTQYAHVTG